MVKLPKAYNGCTCICHKQPGVMHIMACCYPLLDEIEGKIVKKKVGEGSKSERTTFVIISKDGEYIFRKAGGNAMYDPELEVYENTYVKCEGSFLANGSTFQAVIIDPLTNDET